MERRKQTERGVALVMALIALLIVTSIGLSMMFMSDTETTINGNYRDEQTAYYAAKAGLEEARDRMRANASATINSSLPTARLGAVGGALYILNPNGSETVAPWNTTNAYFDDEVCKELNCAGAQIPPTSGWYTTVNASSTYAASPVLPYKWMRITLKTDGSASGWSGSTQNFMYVDGVSAHTNYYVCWNGTNEIAQSPACATPARPVYTLTTLGITPSGTRRMLQSELTQDGLNLSFGAALTLNGTGDSMSGPNSNPFQMDGTDHAGCGGAATQPAKPAIGVTNTADISNVISGIPGNRQDHYTGSGSSPDVENVSATLPANMNSVSSLQALVSTIKSNATQVFTGNQSGLSNPGTATSPEIIYVDGDLSLSGNTTGYGILVVTGTFSPGGNVGWNGIVLVVGKGVVTANGGGNNSYNGAFMVAKTLDSSGNPLSSVGAATFSFSGGGGNGINYSSGCINQASGLSDYRIVSTREMMF
jgi:Tfp pilus assembly protein PilX